MAFACIVFDIYFRPKCILGILIPARKVHRCMCYTRTTPRGNRDTLIPKAKTNLSHSPKRKGPLSEVKMAVEFKGNIRVCCPKQNNKIIVKRYHSLISLKKDLLT